MMATLAIVAAAAAAAGQQGMGSNPDHCFALRGSLANSRIKIEREKKARVAFLGGSITEANGWRVFTQELLKKRYPDTDFDFVDAGISSTDTTLAPFRLKSTVFPKGPVDLLFFEFAVNDLHNSRTATESIRGVEGIIRQARTLNPAIDLVILYCADEDKMEYVRKGQVAPQIAAHEKVAQHYGVSAIDLAREVTLRIDNGEFDWKKFGGLHPSPFGHQLYAASIGRFLDAAWKEPLPADAAVKPHPLPDKPLDPQHYGRGRFVDIKEATVRSGWQLVPNWKPSKGATRKQFVNCPVLEANEPGATLKLKFNGTAIGVLEAAGYDVGILEFSIDGAPFRKLDQFTQWSEGLHIPWAYLFDAELKPGDHELTLRVSADKNPKSQGHAARLLQFLVN
ncbi:MAG TPA: SGNH/GDSL hydrolase family protein [Planctomycetota bacterium]|nr:SGNH/GDSL hydrolase family protein [Planctomycetota bacterium]HRR81333.1 SGNH/GDSL hydrolase family protein [Planctomycetota bacterium]HRT95585.1 SGNH/GDSL hydrolase family protein [Planctomycetota bacterium]